MSYAPLAVKAPDLASIRTATTTLMTESRRYRPTPTARPRASDPSAGPPGCPPPGLVPPSRRQGSSPGDDPNAAAQLSAPVSTSGRTSRAPSCPVPTSVARPHLDDPMLGGNVAGAPVPARLAGRHDSHLRCKRCDGWLLSARYFAANLTVKLTLVIVALCRHAPSPRRDRSG